MRCEECGGPNATKQADPYEEDVNDRVVMRWLCERCVKNLADEI